MHLNPEREFLLRMINFNKRITKADGCYLYDDSGNEYLDFSAQYGAVPFGYNPDFIWHALDEVKSGKQPSFIQPISSVAAMELSKLLVEVAPQGLHYVCFTNSGAESVEAAIKLSRSKTSRQIILGAHNGFHGKTLGAVSATGKEQYRAPFLVDTTGFEHVPFDDLSALKSRLARKDIAAFIVEPIQGEGGMVTPSLGYLREAQSLCLQYGTLFVLDEVQTGLGRTGKLFAAEHENICPDILLIAKALGGGLVPLGAILVKEKVWTQDFGLHHSSTGANNHVTCTVGLAVIKALIDEDQKLIKHVANVGGYLKDKLTELVSSYPDVFESTSGMGLMQAITLRQWSGDDGYLVGMAGYKGYAVPFVSGYLLNQHGILAIPTLSSKGCLRVQPSLMIQKPEIDRFLTALKSVAELIRHKDFASLLGYVVGHKLPDEHFPVSRNIFKNKSPNQTSGKRLGSFAFFMHPTEFEDITRTLPEGFELYSPEATLRANDWLNELSQFDAEPGIVFHLKCMVSKEGGHVEGWLITSSLTPREMMRLTKLEKIALIDNYVNIARDLGVDIVGLGAFTSIITRAGTRIDCEGIHVTTGNSLTAMSSSESLCILAVKNGLNLNAIACGVIGAAGSVGRIAAMNLALKMGKLILFGNPENKNALIGLKALAGEIYRQAICDLHREHTGVLGSLTKLLGNFDFVPISALAATDTQANIDLYDLIEDQINAKKNCTGPIQVTTDLETYLPFVDCLISTTSQGKAFIGPSLLKKGAIVCDAARPADVEASVKLSRPDVLVYDGGLIRMPDGSSFGRNNVIGLPTGVNLACLSETICLAMSQVTKDYSIGLNVPLTEAQFVYNEALKHGFCLSLPFDNEPLPINTLTENLAPA